MLQTSENYNKIQEPTKKKKKEKLEDVLQYKLWDRIYCLSYGLHNMQPTVCQGKLTLDWTIAGKM